MRNFVGLPNASVHFKVLSCLRDFLVETRSGYVYDLLCIGSSSFIGSSAVLGSNGHYSRRLLVLDLSSNWPLSSWRTTE